MELLGPRRGDGAREPGLAREARSLRSPEALQAGELAVFEESSEPISFHAETEVEFVVGSAVKHPHDLVLGYYSVHTSAAALREGEARIGQIGNRLRAEGRLT